MFIHLKAFMGVLISFGIFFLCPHLYARPLTSETEEPVFMKLRRIGHSKKISEEIKETLKKESPFFVPTDPLPSEKNLTCYGILTSVVLLGPKKKYRCAIYTNQNHTTLVYSSVPNPSESVKHKHPGFIKRIWQRWHNPRKASLSASCPDLRSPAVPKRPSPEDHYTDPESPYVYLILGSPDLTMKYPDKTGRLRSYTTSFPSSSHSIDV